MPRREDTAGEEDEKTYRGGKRYESQEALAISVVNIYFSGK
jgi:hypothetical protein